MTWQRLAVDAWEEAVSDQSEHLANRQVANVLDRFSLLPDGADPVETSAGLHHGPLTIDGDFTPPTQLCAIYGDLTVRGKVTTEAVDGADGNATLIVFGDLRCTSLVNDWASILCISGHCLVEAWVFAAREDSSLIIGVTKSPPIFLGADIWASVGGTVSMDYGYGYAVDLSHLGEAFGVKPILPHKGPRELAMKLGLGRQAALDEMALIQALEERLYATGSILAGD